MNPNKQRLRQLYGEIDRLQYNKQVIESEIARLGRNIFGTVCQQKTESDVDKLLAEHEARTQDLKNKIIQIDKLTEQKRNEMRQIIHTNDIFDSVDDLW